jgi:hypothetical protein
MKTVDTLRALLKAAVQFEAKAAHHKRIEREREALNEAITQAQLLLSVRDTANTSPSDQADRPPPSRTTPNLRGLRGGKIKTLKPISRRERGRS